MEKYHGNILKYFSDIRNDIKVTILKKQHLLLFFI